MTTILHQTLVTATASVGGSVLVVLVDVLRLTRIIHPPSINAS